MKYPTEQIEQFLKEVGDLSVKFGLHFNGSVDAAMWTEETRVYWDENEEQYYFKYDVDNNGESEHEWKSAKPMSACEHEWEYKWRKNEDEYGRYCEKCQKYEGRGFPKDKETLREIDQWLKDKWSKE